SEDTADNIILDGHLREIGIRKPAAACGMVPEGDKDQAGQCLGKRIEGHCHRYSGVLDNEGGLKRNERDEQEKEQVQPEQGPVRPVDMLEDPVMGIENTPSEKLITRSKFLKNIYWVRGSSGLAYFMRYASAFFPIKVFDTGETNRLKIEIMT